MAKIVIKKLTHWHDVVIFQKTFNEVLGYSTVPYDYFESGDCHAMFVDGEMVAGFCLVPGFDNLRSWRQIPKFVRDRLPLRVFGDMSHCLCDFTGYFIKDKKYALRFTLYLVKTCLFNAPFNNLPNGRSGYRYRCKYFIYSYQVTEYGLERYYGSGKPLRLHTGAPEHLDGHHGIMEPEHVEILSRWGIVRIFAYRTKRWIMSLLRGRS